MEQDVTISIALIESSEKDNNEFGTGFVVHRDRQATYFLTCAHVVGSVGRDHVQIDGMAATVVAMGAPDNLDLAVLCVQGLSNQAAMKLLVAGKKGDLVKIIGFHDYGKHRSRKAIHGHLGGQISLKKPKTRGGWIKAWDLNMEADDNLQPGYSGSPVMHKNSGKVLGIVSYRRGAGDKGLAISIEALAELWQPGMPLGLLQSDVEPRDAVEADWTQGIPEHQSSTMQAKRHQRQIDSLQRAWDTLADKIENLEQDRIHETRREELDRLGRVIATAKKQQAELETEIGALVGTPKTSERRQGNNECH